MKVYITYDRYEGDEWFNIYQITTDWEEVKKHWKENLKDFISYGPDDCHSYQIQIVDLTNEEYDLLKSHVDDTIEDDDEFMELMIKIFDECVWVHYGSGTNCVISTDGCSDNVDLVKYYMETNGMDPEDDDMFYEVSEEIYSDESLYDKVLDEYLENEYSHRFRRKK